MLRVVLFIILSGSIISSYGQRYAVANTAWNLTSTWSTTPNGLPGASVPTATDDVYTNGRQVIVSANASCRNLFVTFNQANSITINSLRTLTITGTLSGYDDINTIEEFPTAAVISYGSNSSLIFTAANIQPGYDPYVIYFWDETVPIGRATFNFGASVSKNTILSLTFSGLLRVQSGTLIADPGSSLFGNGTAQLQIDNLAALSASDPISNFSTATISGTLSTSNSLDVAGSFNLTSTGIINTAYNNVSGGWWATTPPSPLTLDAASTVNFNRSVSQNIFPLDYGNVTLSGSGTTTKTLVGSGTLNIKGSLTISSSAITFNSNSASAITIGGNVTNAGIWSPSDLVSFNGTGAQSIGGTASVSFNGGLEVNKSAGTLTLNRATMVANGLTITQGTFNLGSQTLTLNSGNLDNDGTLTAGSSTIVISGSTSITGTNPVSFHNLTVNGSGSLTASGTVNISGNLANSGTLNVSSVLFNGSGTAQSITGTMGLTNITSSNSTGVNNNGVINLTGVLTLSGSGRFDADGAGSGVLTLKSSSLSTTASIATLSDPSNFEGNVTIERFLDGPDRWRYLAMPITNGNVGMWKDNFSVTGNFSDPTTPVQDPNVVNSSAPSIYSFNAATQAYTAVGSGGSTSATALSNTTGYSAYVYSTSNVVVNVTGSVTKDALNIPLVANQYNLVPNPYPSSIDWDLMNTTGLSNTMYVRYNGNYASYVKNSGLGVGHPVSNWAGEIALGQSYWVQSVGATQLQMAETNKVGSFRYVREEIPQNYFKIKLEKSVSEFDEVAIWFKEGATTGVDADFDARKKANEGFFNLAVYNTSASELFAINAIPPLSCAEMTARLKVSEVNQGKYTLSFNSLESIQLGYFITLKDNYLNKSVAVDGTTRYEFSVTSDPLTYGSNRFELRVQAPLIDQSLALNYSTQSDCSSSEVVISLFNTQAGVEYQLKSGTTLLAKEISANGGLLKLSVPKVSLSDGNNNLLVVGSVGNGCQSFQYPQTVTVEKLPILQVTAINGSVCGSGTVTLKASGAPVDGYYRWYQTASSNTPIGGFIGDEYKIQNLTETITYYVSSVNSQGCESKRVAVKATVNRLPDLAVVKGDYVCTSGSVTLEASGARLGDAYRWYEAEVGGTWIAGQNSHKFITPVLNATKDYFVSIVSSDGCESAKRVKVVAEVRNITKPQIQQSTNVLSTISGGQNYQWFRNGTLIPDFNTPSIIVTESGTYIVKFQTGGCTIESLPKDFIITSVEDIGRKGINLYPTITSDYIYITGLTDSINNRVNLIGSLGNVIDVPMEKMNNNLKIDVTHFPSGYYFIRIIDERGQQKHLRFIRK